MLNVTVGKAELKDAFYVFTGESPAQLQIQVKIMNHQRRVPYVNSFLRRQRRYSKSRYSFLFLCGHCIGQLDSTLLDRIPNG